jgi:hypothetical protein
VTATLTRRPRATAETALIALLMREDRWVSRSFITYRLNNRHKAGVWGPAMAKLIAAGQVETRFQEGHNLRPVPHYRIKSRS